jgi:hypothetical protein
MKVTKSYLKQVIKEELGRMEEAHATLPMSSNHSDVPGFTAGPTAPGDEARRAVYSAASTIDHMLKRQSEELKNMAGGYYYDQLMDVKEKLESAYEIIMSSTKFDT